MIFGDFLGLKITNYFVLKKLGCEIIIILKKYYLEINFSKMKFINFRILVNSYFGWFFGQI